MSACSSYGEGLKRAFEQAACLIALAVASMASAGAAPGAAEIAQIDCVTPDGTVTTISPSQKIDPKSAVSLIDETTIRCPLRQGETTFVIALPKNLRDRFTFINENAAACGELKIAVADAHLEADSPKWKEVDGIIPFAHKRLFALSLLGIETRFVRLSFHVEATTGETSDRKIVRLQNAFRTSALAEAIDSHFIAHARNDREPVGTSFGSLSVAPLAGAPNE